MIFGLLIVIVAGVVLWYTTRPLTAPVHAVERRIVEVGGEPEIELELSDGRLYRSTVGYVWYSFPSGVIVDVFCAGQLNDESRRLENLERWSHADEKGDGEC